MESCHHHIKCVTTTLLAALMRKRLLNSATLATATHKGVIRVSDRTGAQVGAQMINKCKVQIRMRDLYNVAESFKERDEKCMICAQEIEFSAGYPFLCFCFCNNIVHVSDRLSSLRLSSLTHPLQRFIVCCTLGQGLISRIWIRKIVQLHIQFASYEKMSLHTKAVGRKQMTLRSGEFSNNVKCHLYLGSKLDIFKKF